MNLTETARTRRSDMGYNPILTMPFPHGNSIKTESFITPISQEVRTLVFSLPIDKELDVAPWRHLLKSTSQSTLDMVVFEDELATSAHFGRNTVLDWITDPGPIKTVFTKPASIKPIDVISALTEAVHEFYSINEVSSIGIEDRSGEKSVFVLLNAAEQSDDLLSRLIDIEQAVQGKLSDTYLSFSYIAMAGRSAESLMPAKVIRVKK